MITKNPNRSVKTQISIPALVLTSTSQK